MRLWEDESAVHPSLIAVILLIVGLFGASMLLPSSPDLSTVNTSEPYQIELPDELPEQLNTTGMETCDNFLTRINHPLPKTIGNLYCQSQFLSVKNIEELGYDPLDIFFALMIVFGIGFGVIFMMQKQSSNYMGWVGLIIVIIAAILILLRMI